MSMVKSSMSHSCTSTVILKKEDNWDLHLGDDMRCFSIATDPQCQDSFFGDLEYFLRITYQCKHVYKHENVYEHLTEIGKELFSKWENGVALSIIYEQARRVFQTA